MARDSHEKSIAWKCVQDAKRSMEAGWNHVSDDIRWGLVCANIMSVIAGQACMDDEDATHEQKANVADYALALWREAIEIKNNNWKKA